MEKFFPVVKRIDFSIRNSQTNQSKTSQFYNSCLQESHQSTQSHHCERKITELKHELAQKKIKLQQAEKAYSTCKRICEKKESQIDDINSKLAAQPQLSVQPSKPKHMFVEFSAIFNDPQLSELRSIANNEQNDSSFIFYAVRQLYIGDLKRVKNISLTGRGRGGAKIPMSPQKQDILRKMYKQRLTSVPIDSARHKRINTHIRNAINNIRKQVK